MRRQLASLLRRLADRLYPDDLVTMTITDGAGNVTRRNYRPEKQPIDFKLYDTVNGDISGTITEVGYDVRSEQHLFGLARGISEGHIPNDRLRLALREHMREQGQIVDPPTPVPLDDPPGYTLR